MMMTKLRSEVESEGEVEVGREGYGVDAQDDEVFL